MVRTFHGANGQMFLSIIIEKSQNTKNREKPSYKIGFFPKRPSFAAISQPNDAISDQPALIHMSSQSVRFMLPRLYSKCDGSPSFLRIYFL